MYEGEWKNNMMDGQGKQVFKDGRSYVGEFKKDKKHGHGTYTWSDGKSYTGGWFNGEQHGEGLYTDIKKGKTKKGIWENGSRIRWITESKKEKKHQQPKSPSSEGSDDII